MAHARLSPSAATRWFACPASVREESLLPADNRSSPAAIDGTHSHTLLELALNEMKHPSEYIGQELSDHDGKFVVDKERADRVVIGYDYVSLREKEMKEYYGTYQLFTESKVEIGKYIGRDDLSGTADIILVSDKVLEIVDYKDGIGEVPAENNLQMSCYALGALEQFGWMYNIQTVIMTIVQPKLSLFGKKAISSWTVSADYLKNEFKPLLTEKANATDDENAPYNAGEEQCRWCRAKGSCKALASKAMKEAQLAFEGIDVSITMAQEVANKNPNELSNDEIAKLVEATPLITQFLKAVEEQALERMKSGQVIDGLKVIHGRGSRDWNLEEDEVAEVLRKAGIPKNEVYVKRLLSPAQLSKHTWTNRAGEVKSLSPAQIKRIEDNYIEKKQGKLTVALESAKGEPVVFNAEAIFADVPSVETTEMPAWLLG